MHHQLQAVADSVNPALVLALLYLAYQPRPFAMSAVARFRFLLAATLSLVTAEIVAKVVRDQHLITAKFPSTHFAFALCVLTSLWLLKPRWWPAWGVTALGYGALMVYQGYHTPTELSGALYAVPLAWIVHRFLAPRSQAVPRAEATGL